MTSANGVVRASRYKPAEGEPTSSGMRSAKAMAERHQQVMDARPAVARCAHPGCEDWIVEGTAAECRNAFEQHRAELHPAASRLTKRERETAAIREKAERKRHEQEQRTLAALEQRRGRDLLDMMDAGLPVGALEERDGHKAETPDAKDDAVAWEAAPEPAGQSPTPGEGFDSPRAARSSSAHPYGLTRLGRGWAWTHDAALRALRDFHEQHGRPPSTADTKGSDLLPSANAATRLFGSWTRYLNAAGFEPIPSAPGGHVWTREEAVAALQACVAELGRVPTSDALANLGLPGKNAYHRLFGSWADYVEAAGYPRPPLGPGGRRAAGPILDRDGARLLLAENATHAQLRDALAARFGLPGDDRQPAEAAAGAPAELERALGELLAASRALLVAAAAVNHAAGHLIATKADA